MRPFLLPFTACFLTACSPFSPPHAGTDADANAQGADAGSTEAGSTEAGSTDAGSADAGSADAGSTDAGGTDAGSADAGGMDAGGMDAGGAGPSGFGVLSGSCGVLEEALLLSSAPAFLANRIDFGDDPYDDEDRPRLTAGGQEILDDGNAGGSSLLSEVFAYEVLARCEGAVLLKTETEIRYQNPMGKLTDLLVEIDGQKVGVSVTRAVAFPFEAPYTVERARALLEDKLQGVLDSSANVAPEDAWVKQVLSIIAYSDGHTASLTAAFADIDDALKADTLVLVTTSDGDDSFLY